MPTIVERRLNYAKVNELRTYRISELTPFINWLYFYHAWGLSGKPREDKEKMKQEALQMLASWEEKYHTHAIFRLFEACSEGDDLIFFLSEKKLRFPMLRQQHPSAPGEPNLCLADFIRPLSQGNKRPGRSVLHFGGWNASSMTYRHDDYLNMMAQTLCDRLAEATAEKLHEEVRRDRAYWGYAPDENLTIEQQHQRGIPGHPASHRLSVAARYQCQLPHRPAHRHEAGRHPTHRNRNDDASCQRLGIDVRTSQVAATSNWER